MLLACCREHEQSQGTQLPVVVVAAAAAGIGASGRAESVWTGGEGV